VVDPAEIEKRLLEQASYHLTVNDTQKMYLDETLVL